MSMLSPVNQHQNTEHIILLYYDEYIGLCLVLGKSLLLMTELTT